jgi:Cd2+/Zn2+-exporting ATPase
MPEHDTDTARESGSAFAWKVGGMDCASCVAKIQTALGKLPGVTEVRASTMTETLSATVDQTKTSPDEIETRVAGLGYTLTRKQAPPVIRDPRLGQADHTGEAEDGQDYRSGQSGPVAEAHGHAHAESGGTRWWQTAKGQLVVLTGALLALAWIIKLAFPSAAYWAFAGATLVGLAPVARRAVAAARAGMPFTIEMLMSIAAAGALFIGAAEEAALVVSLFAVGEVLEGVAADRARASIRALGALVPKTALIEENGHAREVPAATLVIGQTVLVRPGDRIPADGVILSGTSGIDEAPVTGESIPNTKGVGDGVFAGSINREAALRVRVAKTAEDNTIARIIRLVEEAQEARAPTERFIDRFSRWYMPLVVGLALLVVLLPPLLLGGAWSTWIYRGLALLLIGCPCALVISVPASIASALSAGARQGLLMKGGAVIEAAAKTQVVAFDKTGTLTEGEPRVTDVTAFAGDEPEVMRLAAAVETGSNHPLAVAIVERTRALGSVVQSADAVRAIPGQGMTGFLAGQEIFLGAPRFAEERAPLPVGASERIAALEAEGKTVTALVADGHMLGLIALRDEPRVDARTAIADLKDLGIRPIMLTGDNARTGAAIAAALGLEYRAEQMPDDKVGVIKALGVRARVMMVGDGINDAPALAAANVGVAMGSGTDVALETADGALLRSRISDVVEMIRLARAAMANIRQNIAIALGLKAVFLVTSVLGLTGLWIAILADTGATVIVTANALRLLGFFRSGGTSSGGGGVRPGAGIEPATA